MSERQSLAESVSANEPSEGEIASENGGAKQASTNEELLTQRGKRLLFSEGFGYCLDRATTDKTIWRCLREKSGHCKGRIWKYPDGRVLPRNEHNHYPDSTDYERRKVLENIRRASKCSFGTSAQLVAEQVESMPAGIATSSPPIPQLKRLVRRTRAAETHACPPILEDLVIPSDQQLDHEGKKFLQYDNGPQAENDRVIIFASDRGLQILASSDIWYMDGTFEVAPRLFYQLYTINVTQHDCFINTVYCLLTDKRQLTCKELLNVIREEVPALNVRVAIADFEIAFIKAFTDVFPAIQLRGCYFHFCQAIWRKIQKFPIVRKAYVENSDFALNVKMLIALAFVPLQSVLEYYGCLISSEFYRVNSNKLEGLLLYFERTWLGLNSFGQWREATFNLSLWNLMKVFCTIFP
ncbi:uncharacterized protein LOC108865132 [Galendromus occidentalis]|uniref:Uncharacterized protein LOC108865132 n=1 Tax=Galendromus occidentalis TaxID=34638 RepID=A0AAJ7PB18_9ACAR|nr:uncharacterized protein LOC108865132 [Galendromus occidentalis]